MDPSDAGLAESVTPRSVRAKKCQAPLT